MKKKVLSVILAMLVVFAIPISAFAAGTDATEEFCKIKRTTATVLINRFEKLEFYADYYAADDKNTELIWTIEGEGKFIDGETEKTAKGENVEMIFIDDTTVKLQLVSSDGKVIDEDEVSLKRYGKDGGTLLQRIFIHAYLGVAFICNMIVEFFKILF